MPSSKPTLTHLPVATRGRYVAAAKWRPVSLFVDLSIATDNSSDGGDDAGGPRLHAIVQTNPQLKSTLQNVSVSVTPPPGVDVDTSRRPPRPEGSSYLAESRCLKWKVCKELVRDTPVTCVAALSAPALEGMSGGAEQLASTLLAGTPFNVQFGCDGMRSPTDPHAMHAPLHGLAA